MSDEDQVSNYRDLVSHNKFGWLLAASYRLQAYEDSGYEDSGYMLQASGYKLIENMNEGF